jgi:dephospho-CoA kinase
MALKVGLTGGMGSGKSTVLEHFAKAGWLTVEADAIVKNLLAENESVIERVRDHFGPDVAGPEGGVNRAALASKVFADQKELEWLEQILHPEVRRSWQDVVESNPEREVVVEIPLLFEKNLEKYFNYTVCIEVELDVQLARLSQRGISPEMAKPRIARQLSTREKCERADYVLSNNGSLAFLHQQVERLTAVLQHPS